MVVQNRILERTPGHNTSPVGIKMSQVMGLANSSRWGGNYRHQKELSPQTGVAELCVNRTIAPPGVQSGSIMKVLFREGFRCADIAYVTDLRQDAVRSIVGRLRHLILRDVVQPADCVVTAVDKHSISGQMALPDEAQYQG